MVRNLQKIKKELPEIIKQFGYESKKDFIEDAILRRVLELRKAEFSSRVEKIKEKMKDRKMTEEEILKDFDKFIHRK